MHRVGKWLAVFLPAVLILLLLAACAKGQDHRKSSMEITVVNRTTRPIADIRISPADSDDWGPSRIQNTLYEGETAKIDLGQFTKEELDAGFHIQIYGEDGAPISPDYDSSWPTCFDDGDWLIFAPPDTNCFLFTDTSYNKEAYDQKIAELPRYDGESSAEVGGAMTLAGGLRLFKVCGG